MNKEKREFTKDLIRGFLFLNDVPRCNTFQIKLSFYPNSDAITIMIVGQDMSLITKTRVYVSKKIKLNFKLVDCVMRKLGFIYVNNIDTGDGNPVLAIYELDI